MGCGTSSAGKQQTKAATASRVAARPAPLSAAGLAGLEAVDGGGLPAAAVAALHKAGFEGGGLAAEARAVGWPLLLRVVEPGLPRREREQGLAAKRLEYAQLRDAAAAELEAGVGREGGGSGRVGSAQRLRDDRVIVCDVDRTLAAHPRHEELKPSLLEILRTYSYHDPPVGYSQGMVTTPPRIPTPL